MMRVSRIEHRPVKVLFDYFERAVEELGLKAWAILLRPGNERFFHNKVALSVYSILHDSRWRHEKEEILSDPVKHLRWEPGEDPEEEIWAHYRLQSAILATLMGDRDESRTSPRNSRHNLERDGKGLRTLAAQLVVEHVNRKLEISHFLGNLTEGKIGSVYPELPTKTQILQWVEEIGAVQLADRLPEIARIKYE